MSSHFWALIGWVVAASILGFAISGVFAGWMKLSRNLFLIPYVSITSIFLYAFFVFNQIDLAGILIHNWPWGILAGCIASLLLVRNVKSQPLSRQSAGSELVLDLTWAGLVYGILDALFLNVMPVVAIWAAASQLGWAATPIGIVGIGFVGLLASLLITLAYHLGYPEFRNKRVGLVLFGNSIITLAFLLSGNPLGSIISHAAMHVAAVFQGPETTIQLPPHHQAGLNLG